MRPLALVLLSTLTLTACETGEASTPAPTPTPRGAPTGPKAVPRSVPPVIIWKGDTARIYADLPPYRQTSAAMKVRFTDGDEVPLVMRIAFTDMPADSTMTAGGVTATVTEQHGNADLEVTLPDVGALPIGALTGPVELAPPMPIEVTLPEQEPVTTTVPAGTVDLRFDLKDALERVPRGPVRFTATDNRLDTAVFIGNTFLHPIGTGKTLADIDWVVDVATRPPARPKRCSRYIGTDDVVTVRFADTVLTVYELRTGRQVAVEVLAPPAGCPSSVLVRDGQAIEYVHEADVKRRVARLLAAGSGRRAR